MRGVSAFAALLAASVLALPADARMHAGPGQLSAGHRLQGMIAPLDGGGSFSAPAAAYSLRRLKSTYAGPAVKLRRASDSATQDINFLGFTGFTGAPIDVAAAAAFCAATSCFFDTWYDQSGNARNATQATLASQPQFIFACQNGLPCVRATSVALSVATPSLTPVMPVTFAAVGNRRVGTGSCNWMYRFGANAQFAGWAANANQWAANGGATGGLSAAASDTVWHAGIATINGASSVMAIDGVETPGSVTGSVTAGVVQLSGSDVGTTCDEVEVLLWDGYALTQPERAALAQNQRGFWGL